MGLCSICGKPAGFLRSKHKECEAERLGLMADLTGLALTAITEGVGLEIVGERFSGALSRNFIEPAEARALLVTAWEKAVSQALEDGFLEHEEERRLISFKEHFSLGQSELDARGAFTRTLKAAVLRDVFEGRVPQRLTIDGNLGLNLQREESVVWTFPGTRYLEDRTRRQYVGRSHGVSVRIVKGVYYRTSAFQGHPVTYTERVCLDTGLLAATNKHLYFKGPAKSFRIPFRKVVSWESFSDGIGLFRDSASAKLQVFVTGDGWFTFNLLSNLSRIA